MWDRRGLVGMAVAVVVAVGRIWDPVARRGVGAVPGEWDLVELAEDWGRSLGDISLLRRCLRASGCWLVAMWMVAEAGMCLQVANGTTLLMGFCDNCRICQ